MRHLKLSLIVLLAFFCSIALNGCGGTLVATNTATGTLITSLSTVDFGQVAVGKTVSTSITLTNKGSAPVEISQFNLTGQPFSISGGSGVPMSVGANASVTVTIQFDPAASGSATGQLTIASNASNGSSSTVSLSGMGVPVLTELNCVNGSVTGASSDTCTVTLNATAASGGLDVNLASNDSAVTVPASVTVPAGASSATFTASVLPVTTVQAATLTASIGGVAETFALELGAAIPVLGISANTLDFGTVPVNSAVTHPLVLSSTGTMPVTVSAASLTGTGFAITGESLPVTLAPGQTTTVSVQFDPSAAGAETGQLSLNSNTSNGTSMVVGLSGTGVPVLSGLSCANSSITGSGTDSCTVTLNAAAASGGFAVSLASNNSLVTVPGSVTVAAGATSANFTASASPVSSTEAAMLTANAGGAAETFALQLNSTLPTLNLSTSNIDFGDVAMNIPATETLTLTSTGSTAVTVSAASVSGAGFAASGASFPLTLNPNQAATLTVQFDPAVTGSTTGALTVSSNSADGASKEVGLLGRGVPKLIQLSCATTTMTGAGTDTCTAVMNAAVPSGGLNVNLASNNRAFTVPSSMTLAAGATSGSFSASVSAVNVAQAVTVSASAAGVSQTAGVQLDAAAISLSVSSSSLSFGNVNVNTASTQTLTLSSTGTSAVTVSAATVAGSGFTVSGATFPITLNPNQTATLTVGFDPTTAGAATGQLTLTSNSLSGTSTLISLSGTGTPVLSGLRCTSGSMTGAGTDSCNVTLNTAAASGGFTVSLTSNNSAVTVPASVTVAAGATTASFTATVSGVSTAATVTLTASANSVAQTFALQLGTGTATLGVSAGSIGFGSVNANTATTQVVTLSSTGTAALTISAATVAGSGFSVSGASFPLTLNPNSTATLTVQFDPTVAGAVSGSLTLTSNSSSGASTVISLSGNGVAALTALNCTSGSITGAGTDSCTVTLNAAAGSNGFSVSLSSNNSAVTVPASVTVAAGATTASFTSTVAAVSTAQTAVLTASAGGVAQTFGLQLNTGVPTLSGLSCSSGSMTGAGTDSCTVTLNVAAASGGFTVSLASNNSAVAVPASVTVAPGAATAGFTATVSAVSTAQTATLSASAGGVAETFALQLGTGGPTLSINSTSVAFGDVTLNSPATQSLILSSTGTAAVTVSTATVTGSGFTVSGGPLPLTLNPNQTAMLSVQFDPTVAGAASGTLTIVSTSLTNPTATVSLSGTGETGSSGTPGEVNLTWVAPTNSPDPVAGYNVYRSASGAYSFAQLNSSVVTQTTYVDTTAQTGQAYDYIVESVDASGTTSAPTNIASVNIP